MAAGRIKGITIEIGGDTTKLTKALSSVDNAIKTTQTNIRDLDKALKIDPGNTNLLKDKQRELSIEIDNTRQKLETEKEALRQMKQTEGFDADSQAARNLQTQIDLDTVALKELERQAKESSSVLGTQMQLAGEKISAVGDKIRGIGNKISGIGRTLTASITVPVVAAGTAAVKMASDYEENLNKVDVAFKNSADQVKEWAKIATAQFGLSENAALEATSLFGDMGTAMGLTEEEAANMSTSLAGLAGDLSSFKNVDIEQAMNALKGVFTGETESLKNLGIVMTQTNLEEFAEKTGRVYKEMSQAEKVALRYEYVLSNTKNAQGDYARTSDGLANSTRTLQASLENLGVAFGQEIVPYITPLIQKLTELIQQFASLDDETKKIIITVAAVAAAVGPALVIVGSVISAIGTIVSAIGTLVSGLGSIIPAITALGAPIIAIIAAIGALVAAFVYFYNTNEEFRNRVNAVIEYIKNAFLTFVENVKQWLSEIIQWVSPIIESAKSMLSALVDFIKAAFDAIKFVIKAFIGDHQTEINAFMINVRTIFQVGFELVKGIITTVLNVLKAQFQATFDLITNILKAFTALLRGDWKGALDAMKAAASSAINGVFNVFNSLRSGLANTLNGIINSMRQWGADMINNLISGITSKISGVANAISGVANTVKSYIHFTEPDVGPLADFHTYMPDMIKEMVHGIDKGIPQIESAMDSMASAMVPGVTGAIQNAGSTTNNTSNAITMNIYGAEGQNVQELADIIQNRINQEVYMTGAVFA